MSSGPTPEQIAEMDAQEKSYRANVVAPVVAGAVEPSPVSTKGGLPISDYLFGVIFVWLVILTSMLLRGKKQENA